MNKLKVLMLEDNQLDAELIQKDLISQPFDFISERVETEKDFITAIHDFEPDIILSDYSLPQFTGFEALEIAQELVPGIPFIIITGSLSEEMAADSIKKGAWDYVLKENLVRLAPAIENAFKLKEEKDKNQLAEDEIKRAAAKWQITFNSMNDAVCLMDNNRIVLQCNQSFMNLLGKTENEISGKHCWEIVHGTNGPIDNCPFEKMIKSLHRESIEFPIDDKWFNIIVDPILDANNSLINAVHIFTDISERKQTVESLQENEKRFRQIFQFSPDSIIIHDMDMNILDANNKAVEEFGYSKTELLKKTILELHPETEQKHSAQVLYTLKKKESISVETKFIRKDGSVFIAEATPCKYTLGSKPIIHVVIRDITERKQAEKALCKSQEQFRIAQDMSPDGFTILRPVRDAQERVVDFTWIYENAAVARLNGTDPEAVVGRRLLELFPGHHGTPFLRAYQQVAESGESCIIESDYSGESMTNPTSFRIVVVPMGDDIAILAQDITKRKQAEEALRESDEKYHSLVESSEDPVYLLDIDLKYLHANRSLLLRYGKSLNVVVGKRYGDFHSPESTEKFSKRIAGVIESAKPKVYEHKSQRDDRSFLRTLSPVISSETGEVSAVTVFSKDITEFKQAEEALKEKLYQLQRFQRLTVGREIDMIELKKEVNELLKKSGQEEKYRIIR